MNSQQITFYFTPEDVLQIDSYLKKNELLLLGQPMPDSKPIILPSLLLDESNSKIYRGHKYIIRSQDIDSVIIKYISEQNYYLVDCMNSPVIETGYSNYKNNCLIKKSVNNSKTQSFLVLSTTLFLSLAPIGLVPADS